MLFRATIKLDHQLIEITQEAPNQNTAIKLIKTIYGKAVIIVNGPFNA
jgi:hypothetical protein